MHNTIHKYELNLVERQNVLLPMGAKIISAQNQREKVCIWAMVDSSAKAEARSIFIVCTGNPIPKLYPDESLQHIDTVQQHGLVWHVFEIITKTTL